MFDPFPGRAAGKRAPFTRQMGLVIIPAGNGDMRQGVRSVDPATVHGRRLSLPQEICSVSLRRLRAPGGGLTAGQKSAEGIVGHVVGKASEALRRRKVETTDRPSRERWLKARTRGVASRT